MNMDFGNKKITAILTETNFHTTRDLTLCDGVSLKDAIEAAK